MPKPVLLSSHELSVQGLQSLCGKHSEFICGLRLRYAVVFPESTVLQSDQAQSNVEYFYV